MLLPIAIVLGVAILIAIAVYLIVVADRAGIGFAMIVVLVLTLIVAAFMWQAKEDIKHAVDLTDCKVIGNSKDIGHSNAVTWRKIYKCADDMIYIR